MSDFKYIGKNIVCEPYTFRSSITASNISSSGIISAKQFVGYIDSASVSISSSYALTASYALNAGGGGTTLITGSTYPITASWAITSSYTLTSSYISITSSVYELSSSFASSSISSSYALSASYAVTASYALNAGTTLITASTYPITSSWSINSISSSYSRNSISASYALTSSYAQTALSSEFAYSSSYSLSSSYSDNSLSSSYALSASYAPTDTNITASWSLNSISSSYAQTASFALNAGGTTLITASTYPITSSWALYSISSSYALTALSSAFAYSSSWAATASYFSGSVSNAINALSSSYALTASYALNGGGGGIFVATSSIIDINISSSVDKFVTDGVNNTYTLTLPSTNPNDLLVFLDGLEQEPTTDYTVSGTTFTMTSIPPANLELEVRKFYSAATINIITSSLNAQYFIGDGVTTQYVLTRSVSNDYDVLISFDGLIQKPTYDYTITGSILNFISPPPTNIDGEIRYLMGSITSLISGSGNSVSSSYAVTSSYVNTLDQIVILSQVSSSLNFANDGAASAGGVPLGGLYRNGNVIQIRLV